MPGIQPIKDNLFGSGKKGVCNRGIGDESQALHVSLSRIVSIRFPEIDMLIGTLKRNLSKLKHKQSVAGVHLNVIMSSYACS